MNPHFHIPYIVPTVLLAVALAFKAPTFLRAWRDPDVRATTLLLTWATAVLVVITPVNIDRLNKLTGIPNIAAPWAYSFLTAFCATSLTMITRWKNEPSERRQRTMRRIYWIYGGIIATLWLTFLLAHVPEPRIYDLDTYYADTPWMREHILLYLVAHMVSSLVAASMLWKWFPQISNRWLKAGVVCLQLGNASGPLYDLAKLIAIGARWSGGNLDVLSTQAAPPFALTQAILVALGFITPQAGPFLQRWCRDQRDYWRLRPLWRLLRILQPAAAAPRFGFWAPMDLRLIQRQQRIHDALRLLAPYYDTTTYHRSYQAAAATHPEEQARAIAGAIAVQAAVDSYRHGTPQAVNDQVPQIGSDIVDHLDTISRAVHRSRTVAGIRQRATSTESVNTHV
jgi:hypothetical protein